MAVTVTISVDNNGNVSDYVIPDSFVQALITAAQEDGTPPLQFLKEKLQESISTREAYTKPLREFYKEKEPQAVVIESEPVHGGTRPTVLEITDNLDRKIRKVITYKYPANHPAWGSVEHIEHNLI